MGQVTLCSTESKVLAFVARTTITEITKQQIEEAKERNERVLNSLPAVDPNLEMGSVKTTGRGASTRLHEKSDSTEEKKVAVMGTVTEYMAVEMWNRHLQGTSVQGHRFIQSRQEALRCTPFLIVQRRSSVMSVRGGLIQTNERRASRILKL
jgi:hypothetical protein